MSNFVKDITFPPEEALNPAAICGVVSRTEEHRSAVMSSMALLLYMQEGAQMWVSREVGDDLRMSHIDDFQFENLEWPARRLELVFEDKGIPTFLAHTYTNAEYLESIRELAWPYEIEAVEDEGIEPDKVLVHLQAEDREKTPAFITYPVATVDGLAAGEDFPNQNRPMDGPLDTPLSVSEMLEMRDLVILLFKVLLFASSEGCAPRKTRENPTRKQHGKAGFKGRPKTDRFIVEYLPHHRAEKKHHAEDESKKRKFLGRRGHWRHFHSDRFKAMRGKRRFIYPILGPDGTVPKRRKFVVR